MKFSTLAMVLSLTLLASCGGGSGGGSKSSNKEKSDSKITSASYQSHCVYSAEMGTYSRAVLETSVVDGEKVLTVKDLYFMDNDSGCTGEAQLANELVGRDYIEADEFTIEALVDAAYFRPLTKRMAKAMNEAYTCGRGDWKTGKAYKISGSCTEEIVTDTVVTFSLDKSSVTVKACPKNRPCQTFSLKRK